MADENLAAGDAGKHLPPIANVFSPASVGGTTARPAKRSWLWRPRGAKKYSFGGQWTWTTKKLAAAFQKGLATRATFWHGTATRKAGGWHAQTDVGEPREMFVPFSMAADDPVGALLLCREQGLLVDKLNRMSPELADVIYGTTIPEADLAVLSPRRTVPSVYGAGRAGVQRKTNRNWYFSCRRCSCIASFDHRSKIEQSAINQRKIGGKVGGRHHPKKASDGRRQSPTRLKKKGKGKKKDNRGGEAGLRYLMLRQKCIACSTEPVNSLKYFACNFIRIHRTLSRISRFQLPLRIIRAAECGKSGGNSEMVSRQKS